MPKTLRLHTKEFPPKGSTHNMPFQDIVDVTVNFSVKRNRQTRWNDLEWTTAKGGSSSELEVLKKSSWGWMPGPPCLLVVCSWAFAETLHFSSSSYLVDQVLSQGALAMCGDILHCHKRGRGQCLVSSGWKPEMQPNKHLAMLRTAPDTTENDPAPNVTSAEAEKPWGSLWWELNELVHEKPLKNVWHIVITQ